MDVTQGMSEEIVEAGHRIANAVSVGMLNVHSAMNTLEQKVNNSIGSIENKIERCHAVESRVSRIERLINENADLTKNYTDTVDTRFDQLIASVKNLTEINNSLTDEVAMLKNEMRGEIDILRTRIKKMEAVYDYSMRQTIWQRIFG